MTAANEFERRLAELTASLEVAKSHQGYRNKQQARKNRGITRANAGVARVERRTSVLEDMVGAVTTRVISVVGLVRREKEVTANHEQRISRIERGSAASAQSVITFWLAAVSAFGLSLLLAWHFIGRNITTSYNNKTIELWNHPGYDEIFVWTLGIGIVLMTVAAVFAAQSRHDNPITTTTVASSRDSSESRAAIVAIDQTQVQTRV